MQNEIEDRKWEKISDQKWSRKNVPVFQIIKLSCKFIKKLKFLLSESHLHTCYKVFTSSNSSLYTKSTPFISEVNTNWMATREKFLSISYKQLKGDKVRNGINEEKETRDNKW